MLVAQTRIKRDPKFLYYLDKQGDISRVPYARAKLGVRAKGTRKVAKTHIKREPGFLYFINQNGDVCKVASNRKARISHNNPDGACACGATHTLTSESDRKHFSKEEIKKQILNRIHGCEEVIEDEFKEIKIWLKRLEDPP